MKVAAVSAIVLVALAIAPSIATAPRQRPAPLGNIHVETTVSAVRFSPDYPATGSSRTTHLLLWNRDESSRPIGYAFVQCQVLGDEGAFALRPEMCRAYYSMPLGKLIAVGVAYARRSYFLVLAGGAGRYAHAAGVARFDHGDLLIAFQ